MTRRKNSQRHKAQPSIKTGVPKHQVPTTASPSIGTSPECRIKMNLRFARQDDEPGIWSELCIYRVPQYLRVGNDAVYLPRIVSLGPYHHDKGHTHKMIPHKWRDVSRILERCNQDFKLYFDAVKRLVNRAAACYEKPFLLSRDEFVEMMVLDGCFILELFRGVDEGFDNLGYCVSDPIFSKKGLMHSIKQDMILLENQIPLFVLDLLFELQAGQPVLKGVVSMLALKFFDPLRPTDEPLSMEMENRTTCDPQPGVEDLHILDVFRRSLLRTEPQPTPDICTSDPQPDIGGLQSEPQPTPDICTSDPGVEDLHILDVFRRSLLRTEPQPTPDICTSDPQPDIGGLQSEPPPTPDICTSDPQSDPQSEPRATPRTYTRSLSNTHRVAAERRQQLIHCATKLRESGINFKTRKTDRFWDIKFKDGVLSIPKLLIHDGTKTLFFNLIAFEQCHRDSTKDITSYVVFMDNLINSAEDVSILHRCGIIEHWLGSEAEVAKLFNRNWQEVVFSTSYSYLCPVSDELNRHCEIRWNTWRATLHHKYFNNPWAVISIIAAVVLLSLTFAQTFYGVFAYYRPPS